MISEVVSAKSAALGPSNFFNVEEVDVVLAKERPYYVLPASLQNPIMLRFKVRPDRYFDPHIPCVLLEAMSPSRLFKEKELQHTDLMRGVKNYLAIPR